MPSTTSRPQADTRPDVVSGNQDTIERLLAAISTLVAERQELRSRDASETALEQNRRRIARLQYDLAYAVIERHSPTRRSA